MRSSQAKRVNPAQKNKRQKKTGKDNKQRDRLLSKVLGFFFAGVVAAILLQGIFGYIHSKIQAHSEKKEAKEAKILAEKKKKEEIIPTVKPLAEDDPSLPKSYDFYYNLVNRKVSIESDKIGGQAPKAVSLLDALPPIELIGASETSAPPKPASDDKKQEEPIDEPKITFQIATFIQKADADKFAELLNQTNLKAAVSKYKDSSHGDTYQVKLGPYSQTQANQVRKTLQKLKLKPIEFKNE